LGSHVTIIHVTIIRYRQHPAAGNRHQRGGTFSVTARNNFPGFAV